MDGTEKELIARIEAFFEQAKFESNCYQGDDYDYEEALYELLAAYKGTTYYIIKKKALSLIKELIKYDLVDWINDDVLSEMPSEVQKSLFDDLYNEMIQICFDCSPDEFKCDDYDRTKRVLDNLKDKSLLRGILDKIIETAIENRWDDIIDMILNDKSFISLKDDTKYCLFDYFRADLERLSILYEHVPINLSSSFSGIICREEEMYLNGVPTYMSFNDSVPFTISYTPRSEYRAASPSSLPYVLEVMDHQKQWIQMWASIIFGNSVKNDVTWWSLYNGLMSDDRGLVTDVDDFLIGICNSLLIESGFYRVNLPLIVLKDEENILEDNIFNLLGEYVAEKQEVILYGRAISYASLQLDVDEKVLRAVVLIHELGHYITHAHPLKGIAEEPFDNALFSRSDPDFLECIAQLFAYWVTKGDGKCNSQDVFDKLASKQSGSYKVYLKYVNEPPKIILQAIAVLRASTEVVTISDFELVINKLKD